MCSNAGGFPLATQLRQRRAAEPHTAIVALQHNANPEDPPITSVEPPITSVTAAPPVPATVLTASQTDPIQSSPFSQVTSAATRDHTLETSHAYAEPSQDTPNCVRHHSLHCIDASVMSPQSAVSALNAFFSEEVEATSQGNSAVSSDAVAPPATSATDASQTGGNAPGALEPAVGAVRSSLSSRLSLILSNARSSFSATASASVSAVASGPSRASVSALSAAEESVTIAPSVPLSVANGSSVDVHTTGAPANNPRLRDARDLVHASIPVSSLGEYGHFPEARNTAALIPPRTSYCEATKPPLKRKSKIRIVDALICAPTGQHF